MNKIEQALALREGGQTIRCHTMQYVGPYNVAIHSYNMLVLLMVLHPEQPSYKLIKAITFHDTPERWTGDLPTPAKLASPLLCNVLAGLEKRIFTSLGIGSVFTDLSPEEQNWLRGVDLLELFIWGREQLELGNNTVRKMNKQILIIFENNRDATPKEVLKFVKDFKWSRTDECHDLVGNRKDEQS